ncbi:uncharacterized protein LOC106090467 [Stomoxys calcitrans]|uniref:uncharacterized protein LOC106090467 n=1 Tax=Stomoxys calcitrans TaxID=35570 RepID=UPI0027E36C87|nr:uncharacterized protein LOC106090467 [Stomoxys calcitrans]
MFRLLLPATKCKQQQIAILIISFFLYVNGIRNEGNNMLQQQPLLHTPIENSNYHSPSSTNSIFQPSPLIEFTLADVTQSHGFKPLLEDKYLTSIPPTPISQDYMAATSSPSSYIAKTDSLNDNRRYSTSFTNGEQQFSFPNEQQHQQGFLSQQQLLQQQQQQDQHFAQQLTEMPIYIYKDPYTNENYHYTPTKATSQHKDVASPATYTHNNYNGYGGYQQQQQQQQQQFQPTVSTTLQHNQEYLVHSSMLVGNHAYEPSRKDVYQKRPGQVYDESYSSHPNAVVEKKSEVGMGKKPNKISYDSHDYPPPSYHQQHTSNFLPTPVPSAAPSPRPTPPPVRATQMSQIYYTTPRPPQLAVFYDTPSAPQVRPPPSYATPRPPPSQDYNKPRPPSFVVREQPYLQSSQNVLPNYANNLDNYLPNKQQTEYYRPPEYPSQQYDSNSPPPGAPFRQQYQQTSFPPFGQQSSPPPFQSPASSRPSYNNYYDYQIGEIPPQTQGAFNYPYTRPPPQYNGPYRPPYAPSPTTPQPSGLATLVQYAPQFTSLLLGGGGSSNTNSPLGSLLGALAGANTPQSSSSSSTSSYNRRPINSQLIRALENIARNDDLQCVPKVLCQMIAGQTQRGQLPSFITSPTITNFLAGFPASSPALIYGRAALLGISGGERSCHSTYVKCPKNEIEIINYLNNHRGGFFKFFSEPDDQSLTQQNVNQDSFQSGASSFLSILSALTGTAQELVTTPRPRPKPQPQPASSDITETIGNFFTNLLSDYMGEGATVEYQRRRLKRSTKEKIIRFESKSKEDDEHYNFSQQAQDYNDDEDTEDTQKTVDFVYEPDYQNDDDTVGTISTEARVLHPSSPKRNHLKFFPEDGNVHENNEKSKDDITTLIEEFNELNKGRKLKFPSTEAERQYIDVAQEYVRDSKHLKENDDTQKYNYGHHFTNYEQESYDQNEQDSKKIKFYNEPEEEKLPFRSEYSKEIHDLKVAESNHDSKKIKFPEREGKILNRPYYAASYTYNQQQQIPYEENEDKFVVPNHQRPQLREQEYSNSNEIGPLDYNRYKPPERPENYYEHNRPSVYNTQISSSNSVNNYLSNTAINHNHYTSPWPQTDSSDSSSNKGSVNYFLPTPAPDNNDLDKEYNNAIYPNNNFQAGNGNYKPYNSYETNSNRYTSSSSSITYQSQTYNGNRRPYDGSSANYASNKYPSSSYPANNDRYHSSHYINRYTTTTTTTPKPRNDNIYVTNSRGETEYYIRPDGRKIYL